MKPRWAELRPTGASGRRGVMYRIHALEDIPSHGVKKGDIGGTFVLQKSILAPTINNGTWFTEGVWIDNSELTGTMYISGNTRITESIINARKLRISDTDISYSSIVGSGKIANSIIQDSRVAIDKGVDCDRLFAIDERKVILKIGTKYNYMHSNSPIRDDEGYVAQRYLVELAKDIPERGLYKNQLVIYVNDNQGWTENNEIWNR